MIIFHLGILFNLFLWGGLIFRLGWEDNHKYLDCKSDAGNNYLFTGGFVLLAGVAYLIAIWK
jgi:hypothetical protein